MKHTLLILLITFPFWLLGQQRLSFSGQVTDAKTGKSIEGASIVVEDKQTGTIADSSGNFFLHLISDQYKVTFSAHGYTDQVITFSLTENTIKEVKMQPSPKENRRITKTVISRMIRHDEHEAAHASHSSSLNSEISTKLKPNSDEG